MTIIKIWILIAMVINNGKNNKQMTTKQTNGDIGQRNVNKIILQKRIRYFLHLIKDKSKNLGSNMRK